VKEGIPLPKKRLKIGFFVDVFFPMIDGVAVVVDNYAKRLAKEHDVTVFCPKARDKSYVDDFPYRVVRSLKLAIPKTDYDLSLPIADWAFAKALLESKLDIVHIHSPFSIGQAGIEYAKLHRVPIVATIHSQYKRDFLERSESKLLAEIGIKGVVLAFNACDECWPVNNTMAGLYRDFGVRKPIHVHHNATDLVPLQEEADLELRQKYGIQDDEAVLLFVGRIDPIKNIFFTLEALEHLKRSGTKFKMLFVGSGPAIAEMERQIRQKGLSECVLMPGRIVDRTMLARHYRLADLFLFPSLYDASSLVQIEAASQKTPAVFLQGAATADTITDNVNGYLAKNDPRAYADRVAGILGDKASLSKVAEAAYRDLYQSWDDAVKKAERRYVELIEDKKAQLSWWKL
jgi:glycosyltransferase involved in cell wall biosynthesis